MALGIRVIKQIGPYLTAGLNWQCRDIQTKVNITFTIGSHIS